MTAGLEDVSTGHKKMKKLSLKRQGGYSLIEVVIALAVLSIGILAIAKLQISAINNNATGNFTTQATLLAEARLENLKNTSDVSLLTDLVETGINQTGQPGGIFTRTTTITNPLGGNYSRQVEVTVQWRKHGRIRRVVLNSLTQGNGI